MSLTLTLSSGAVAGLNDRAAELGVSPEDLAVQVLEARFTGLIWQAEKLLEVLWGHGALPAMRVSRQTLDALWSTRATGAVFQDLKTGVDALYAAQLIDGVEPNGIVLTDAGYDRMIATYG